MIIQATIITILLLALTSGSNAQLLTPGSFKFREPRPPSLNEEGHKEADEQEQQQEGEWIPVDTDLALIIPPHSLADSICCGSNQDGEANDKAALSSTSTSIIPNKRTAAAGGRSLKERDVMSKTKAGKSSSLKSSSGKKSMATGSPSENPSQSPSENPSQSPSENPSQSPSKLACRTCCGGTQDEQKIVAEYGDCLDSASLFLTYVNTCTYNAAPCSYFSSPNYGSGGTVALACAWTSNFAGGTSCNPDDFPSHFDGIRRRANNNGDIYCSAFVRDFPDACDRPMGVNRKLFGATAADEDAVQNTDKKAIAVVAPQEQDEDDETAKIPMKKDNTVAAFVRVPKTGSTTMLRFLHWARKLFAWSEYLSKKSFVASGNSRRQNKKGKSGATLEDNLAMASSCVYGHVPTKTHLGTNFWGDNDASDVKQRQWWNACPHIPYPGLVRHWGKTLQYWEPPTKAVFENDAVPGNFTFALQSFSMVRDPFDRLISYFYYLGKFVDSNQFLKDTVTEAQYDRVMAGDLYGWMELLHEEGGGRGLKLPFQYRYFHDDLETAIDLIEEQESPDGDIVAPKIFIMVTECYEPSLRLMAEAFDGFEPDSVDSFVKSSFYSSNKNKGSITNKESYKNNNNKEGNDFGGLKSLREKAEVWFADDFVFYDAAVAQFQKNMARSKLDPAHFEGCPYWNAGAGANKVGAAVSDHAAAGEKKEEI